MLSSLTNCNNRAHYCKFCLHRFSSERVLDDHVPYCKENGPQRIKFPDDKHNVMSFKNFKNQLKVTYCIYADFEAFSTKLQNPQQNPNRSSTTPYAQLDPSGYCYVVVDDTGKMVGQPVVYRGPDVTEHFLTRVTATGDALFLNMRHNEPMVITAQDQQVIDAATLCSICRKELGDDRVRDHCHSTGKFRGMAHNQCNLNFKSSPYIPVIFHNGKNFDFSMVVLALGKFKERKLSVIPHTTEKYLSFSLGPLRFIDSYQFLNASLSTLVSNLAQGGRFNILTSVFPADKAALLVRKGVFPYDYVQSPSNFTETSLPPKASFYSHLSQSHISNEDYTYAHHIWTYFDIQHLGEYHDLYMLTDVLLLADVFENFRTMCMTFYSLDCAHYYSLPGFSWDAMLKMTDVHLDLIQDPDMHLFFESGIRGGISVITQRYSKANNPLLDDYDPNKPNSYIIYKDMNSLYGTVMVDQLPTGSFKWIDPTDFVLEHPNTSLSHIIECDLDYPSELHRLHSDFPLAVQKMCVPTENLSPYSKALLAELGFTHVSTQKLVQNLNSKPHYVLHEASLKLFLSLGLKLTKIHRVLQFAQSAWLAPYIHFNIEQRRLARFDFEKDFFKLMINSVYGKTIENQRKHLNLDLIHTENKLLKLSASSAFESCTIFNEDVCAVKRRKITLLLNKPIYVGFAILELSKILMYKFHYQHMLPKYNNHVKLLFSDTDSFCYEITTPDVYKDMEGDLSLYDTSNYPPSHFLFSNQNKKQLGKFKDETGGIPISEFVGLRPKMYSLLLNNKEEQKRAKGISRHVVSEKIRHQNYKECLFNHSVQYVNMSTITRQKHILKIVDLCKLGLTATDDKRYILENGVDSLPHGHSDIPLL